MVDPSTDPQVAAVRDPTFRPGAGNRQCRLLSGRAIWASAPLLLMTMTSAAWAEAVDYRRDIKPILTRCYACHGVLKQEGGLRLDAVQLARAGGDSGAAIVAHRRGESLLVTAVRGTGTIERMPLEGKPLDDQQLELIERWIDEGAPADDEPIPADPNAHWSYQRPRSPLRPGLARHPIDDFLASSQPSSAVVALGPADRPTLLRRVYIDLVGIPPTRTELHEFLADESADAYERVVDRLLASPQHGERWARHWMDVWRYSDWDGHGAEVRESKPFIWRWRDWIVDSLNADKPYDRMIVEMLAGDELAPEDPEALRATGYLVRNWHRFNRNTWLDNVVEHTSKAFLGVTINCTRCHDHKYDPLQQADYYRLRAYFEPYDVRNDPLPGQPDLKQDALVRAYDANLTAPTYLYRRGDEKQPDRERPVEPGLPSLLGGKSRPIEAVHFLPTAYYPALRPNVQQALLSQAEAEQIARRRAVADAEQALAAANRAAASAPTIVSGARRLDERFDAFRSQTWQVVGGAWEIGGGAARQLAAGEAWHGLVTAQSHPRDFLATIRFRTTGGVTWKSTGLSFDVQGDGERQSIYLSAYSGASKVQFERRAEGMNHYAPETAATQTVELHREYELRVAVQGSLVNVWVDGEPRLAFTLPAPRIAEGRFAIWTYDATAEFTVVSLEELESASRLVEQVTPNPAAARELAERELSVARLGSTSSEAAYESLRARIAADAATFFPQPGADAVKLAALAGCAERASLLRQAELKLATVERDRAKLTATGAAAKKLTEAESAIAAARQAVALAAGMLDEENAFYSRVGEIFPDRSSGRRLSLARQIASSENPLTARVAINQVWMRHFGVPLVSTVFDFGLNGQRPTHPELLDYLAVELMQADWRMKPIHRLIVTSDAYRRAAVGAISVSAEGAADRATINVNRASDPDNRQYWRFPSHRMEAETIRDSALAVAGELDWTRGGPDLDEQQGLTVPRRSLYFRCAKEKKVPFLAVFDSPNVLECYRRNESILPQQALAMANSELTRRCSRRLARQLAEEIAAAAPAATETSADNSPSGLDRDAPYIVAAFEQVLSRRPSADELEACRQFLAAQRERLGREPLAAENSGGPPTPSHDPAQRANESLIHVLLNHHDFVTIR